jgi:hypothetical protein
MAAWILAGVEGLEKSPVEAIQVGNLRVYNIILAAIYHLNCY